MVKRGVEKEGSLSWEVGDQGVGPHVPGMSLHLYFWIELERWVPANWKSGNHCCCPTSPRESQD